MRLFPFSGLSILAIYGAVAFTVVYFAARLAMRHERGAAVTISERKSVKSFWFTILAVIAFVMVWDFWGYSHLHPGPTP